jgi:hypothetical protein
MNEVFHGEQNHKNQQKTYYYYNSNNKFFICTFTAAMALFSSYPETNKPHEICSLFSIADK